MGWEGGGGGGGGGGEGKSVFEVQNNIHARLFRKTKSCTAISLAWEQAPQLGESSNERNKKPASQAKRYSLRREKGPSSPRNFLRRFTPFFARTLFRTDSHKLIYPVCDSREIIYPVRRLWAPYPV